MQNKQKDIEFLRQRQLQAEKAAARAEIQVMAADAAMDKYLQQQRMTRSLRGFFRRTQ